MMNMPRQATVFGLLLIVLGIVGYAATGAESITALIPAFFGIVMFLLGRIAVKESARKTTMHIAAVWALLGLLGTVQGLISLGQMLTGSEIPRPAAAISQSIMAILCLIFIVMAVNSFLAARRAPTAQ
jgi:hypothetical protein